MLKKYNLDQFATKHLKHDYLKEVVISKVTTFDEASLQVFMAEVNEAENTLQPNIFVTIDSYGGRVHSLAGMLSTLDAASKDIVTYTPSKAMSCGAFLLGFGTPGKRFASPNSIIMFHNMGSDVSGNPDDIEVKADYFKKLQKFWCTKLAKHCGHKDSKYFLKLLKEKGNTDIYMTPEEAKEHKLIDHIGTPVVTLNVGAEIKVSLE